ncbi:hypothetical protein [Microbispora sp. NPDC049125]|uniref:hypothetical protein n=1 Tax=Microbispora sp. NPDC049125 TaxID=3154929 RepID=UPI0034661B83
MTGSASTAPLRIDVEAAGNQAAPAGEELAGIVPTDARLVRAYLKRERGLLDGRPDAREDGQASGRQPVGPFPPSV